MKNFLKTICILWLAGFTSILIFSCSKDETKEKKSPAFADIQLNDIKQKATAMTSTSLVISNSGGVVWKAGDVFIYKTASGNYGKFQVVSVTVSENYKLTINAITFKQDGTILSINSAMPVRGTWFGDLDATKEAGDDGTEDFKNNRLTNTDTEFAPLHGAVFVKYSL